MTSLPHTHASKLIRFLPSHFSEGKLLVGCLAILFRLQMLFCVERGITIFRPAFSFLREPGSSVSLTTYWTTGRSRFDPRHRIFSSSLCVQTGCGAYPASSPMDTGGRFPGGKARPGRDVDHSSHLVPRS
jgi:hypothetical protein